MEKHDFLSQVIHSFDDKNLYSVIKVTKAIHRNQTFVHQKLYFLTLGKYRCVKSEIFINISFHKDILSGTVAGLNSGHMQRTEIV